MRILNAEPYGYSEEALRILETRAQVEAHELTRSELLAAIHDYDVLIVRLRHQIDEEILSAAKRLRVIATATTGLDHIDLAAAGRHGLEILSLQGETVFLDDIPASAEHTWALLLSLVRNVPFAFEDVRRGNWNRDAFRGHDLAGRRIGILGLGRNGRKVAGYAHAFGMSVAGYDPGPIDTPPQVERVGTLTELLPNSDVLTLHLPLTAATAGCVAREQIALLPRGAFIVNTSRGELIDTNDLLDGLRRGHLAGAALDVVPDERSGERPDLQALRRYAEKNRNLIVTPHIGGATKESMARTEIFIARKIADWIEGLEREAQQGQDP